MRQYARFINFLGGKAFVPGEPLRLLCGDVNLESGDIYIRETKRHKDRHIIMSEDMRELCREYHARAGERTWFFVSRKSWKSC